MKKTISIAMLIVLGTMFAKAQPFQKGSSALSALIGLGSSLGYYHSSQAPALSVNFEKGLWDIGSAGVISLGGYAGYKRFSYKGSNWRENWNYTIIGVRSAFHYNGINSDNFDVYGGLMISYNILKYKWKYTDGTTTPPTNTASYGNRAGMTAFVGGRYFFTPALAANAELGYGVAYLNVGLSLLLGGSK